MAALTNFGLDGNYIVPQTGLLGTQPITLRAKPLKPSRLTLPEMRDGGTRYRKGRWLFFSPKYSGSLQLLKLDHKGEEGPGGFRMGRSNRYSGLQSLKFWQRGLQCFRVDVNFVEGQRCQGAQGSVRRSAQISIFNYF